jgi:hypothetical protein
VPTLSRKLKLIPLTFRLQKSDFYYQKCVELANSSRDVHFVGVVDDHGKLVAGQENRKNSILYNANLKECRFPRPRLKFPLGILNYIVQAIIDIRYSLDTEINNSQLKIQISGYDFVDSSLIVLPFNIQGDIFLCNF